MRREVVLRLLKEHRAEIADFGVKSLALFGSVARDEAREDSDVDILVEFHGPTTFRAHVGLLLLLERILGAKVDLATPPMIGPEIEETVRRDLLRVA